MKTIINSCVIFQDGGKRLLIDVSKLPVGKWLSLSVEVKNMKRKPDYATVKLVDMSNDSIMEAYFFNGVRG